MNEQEMQSELATQRELIAALSGRIDRFDRENFARNMRDARTDKRIFGHGDALRDHVGDGLAHVIRDGMADRGIPGMDDLSDETAAAGHTIDAAMMTWNIAVPVSAIAVGLVPFDTKETESDATVVKCSAPDKGIVAVAGGLYMIHGVIRLNMNFGSDPDSASGGVMLYVGLYTQQSGADLELSGHTAPYNAWSNEVTVDWVGTVPAGAVITLEGLGSASLATMSYAKLFAIRLAP
jgi:hypothetical protein